MIPQTLNPAGDACELSSRWTISPELARRLLILAATFFDGRVPLQIISGFRSVEQQLELRRSGRPAADPQLSTHCTCPATGADVWPGIEATGPVRSELGRAARIAGLRWGGGSPVDPGTGIPSDWNHVDLGPVGSH